MRLSHHPEKKEEETMKVSNVAYGGVKVIGHMSSFAIVRFDTYEDKQQFKRWLETYGEEVKKERGIRFGESIDKDGRARNGPLGR